MPNFHSNLTFTALYVKNKGSKTYSWKTECKNKGMTQVRGKKGDRIRDAFRDFEITLHCLIYIHDIFSAVINTLKTKNKPFKALGKKSEVHCS